MLDSKYIMRLILLLNFSILVISCASSSHEIATTYVSPTKYAAFNCDQLSLELARLNTRKTDLAASIDKKASSDESMTAVSAILFWPAVFALGGNEAQEAEYARLKGEFDAVQKAGIEKNCNLNPKKPVVSPLIAHYQTEKSNELSAYSFYGEAEEEVNSENINRDLWARALVEVNGEESKRKAKYIELRANQLYTENLSSASTTNLSSKSNSNSNTAQIDFTGTYTSKLVYTSVPNGVRTRWYFGKKPDIQLRIVQQDNKITAYIGGDRSGKLEGVVDGQKITFEFLLNVPGDTSKEGSGVWSLNEDLTTLSGNWNIENGPFILAGNWDLTKIE